MAALRSGSVCGAVSGGRDGGIIPSRSRDRVWMLGWTTHWSWRLEPEMIWVRPKILERRKCGLCRLPVLALDREGQNVDLPRVYPKNQKRPPVIPRKSKMKVFVSREDRASKPPGNGMLVEYLIPVAHDLMAAKRIVTEGVEILLRAIPVFACRGCSEIHIGNCGHNLRTCRGAQSSRRNSLHDWVKGNVNDIFLPVDAYHLEDRLAPPITHDRRFEVDRIPALDELCIQAGVDVPSHPTKRYTEPIQLPRPARRKGKIDDGEITLYTSEGSYQIPKLTRSEEQRLVVSDRGHRRFQENATSVSADQAEGTSRRQGNGPFDGRVASWERSGSHWEEERAVRKRLEGPPLIGISSEDDLQTVGEKTLQAWERMTADAKDLMSKYRVVACGYCPEVHVGPRGHRGRSCGAFKHQWRDGQHGWQDASVEDLIPPKYVWHVRDRFGPALENPLRAFYGKAPAVVELCVHAGAPVPDRHKPIMRLDIAIPTLDEYENVI